MEIITFRTETDKGFTITVKVNKKYKIQEGGNSLVES